MKPPPQDTIRQLYIGDNLAVMRGLNSETVDLIYLDPPFNSKSLHKGTMGSKAEKQQFKDTWKMSDINKDELSDIKIGIPDAYRLIKLLGDINGESWYAYLTFMAVRLNEMHRILKDTGSIYLHCDDTMSAPLKLLMDIVFSANNFRNEIIWCYTKMAAHKQKQLSRAHNTIFWYSKTNKRNWKFDVDAIRLPYSESSKKREGHTLNRLGSGYSKEGVTVLNPSGKFPEDWIIHIPYLRQNERTGWATQKPLALLERIIKASSEKGDLVLDPFCGCSTACIAAEHEERQWIGIDIDKESAKIMEDRAQTETNLLDIWDGVQIINAAKVANLPRRSDIEEINKNDRRIKADLYRRQNGKCGICKLEFPIKIFEYDRVKSGKRGGRYTADNVELLCPTCNRIKSGDTRQQAVRRVAEKRIFDELGENEDE